jgi:hypothetical protein
MGNEQDLKPDDWTRSIDKTKARLDRRLEILGSELNAVVKDIASSAKETIADVKEQLTLRYQTEQRPWTMIGASVVTGAIVGATFGPKRAMKSLPENAYASANNPTISTNGRPHHLGSAIGKLTDEFDGELRLLKGLAIGALIGTLRDLGKEALSSRIAPKFGEIVDSATVKLGGTPI